jgi:hypothetical protein
MSDYRIVKRHDLDGSVWFVIQKLTRQMRFVPGWFGMLTAKLVPVEPVWRDYVHTEKHPWLSVDILCRFSSLEEAEEFLERLLNPKDDEVVFTAPTQGGV